MKFFDSFNVKKAVEPLSASTGENAKAIQALSLHITDQFVRMNDSLKELSVQTQKSIKELSIQTEELYDCMSDGDPVCESDINSLVDTIIALRDNIEPLREYSIAGNDKELLRQVDLLLLIYDRNLSDAGIIKMKREGKTYDRNMDIVADIAYEPNAPSSQIIKELSGCYQYRGKIVKRASVIVNKEYSSLRAL